MGIGGTPFSKLPMRTLRIKYLWNTPLKVFRGPKKENLKKKSNSNWWMGGIGGSSWGRRSPGREDFPRGGGKSTFAIRDHSVPKFGWIFWKTPNVFDTPPPPPPHPPLFRISMLHFFSGTRKILQQFFGMETKKNGNSSVTISKMDIFGKVFHVLCPKITTDWSAWSPPFCISALVDYLVEYKALGFNRLRVFISPKHAITKIPRWLYSVKSSIIFPLEKRSQGWRSIRSSEELSWHIPQLLIYFSITHLAIWTNTSYYLEKFGQIRLWCRQFAFSKKKKENLKIGQNFENVLKVYVDLHHHCHQHPSPTQWPFFIAPIARRPSNVVIKMRHGQ